MSYKASTIIANAFSEGIAKKSKNQQSTGKELFLFGNKVAEYRTDGLYISNGGYIYTDRHGNDYIASKSTKEVLNAIPLVNIHQSKKIIYLNGKEWDGSWIKIEGAVIPDFDESKLGDVFSTETRYVRTDGWRGYSEPKYAVVGANDTGMSSDSPCPTHVNEEELKAIANELKRNGIETKKIVTETSNVFCVHVYLLAKIKQVTQAREIVKEFLANNETRLSYLVAGE